MTHRSTCTGRSFLKELDFTPEEWRSLLDLAAELKPAKRSGAGAPAAGRANIALIFEKASTRTRCAFEVAAHDQGAHVTYLDPSGSHIGHKESVEGHRPRARPDVRRHRVPRLRPGHRRDAGRATPACRCGTA